MELIKIYSSPNCPRCKILKKKLEGLDIEYEDTHNVEELAGKGFAQLPIIKIGDEYLSFSEMTKRIAQRRIFNEN